MNPALIVTCKAGNEDICEEEIGNVLLSYDNDIRIDKSRFPGVLIVYSKMNTNRLYKLALSSEYGFVMRIIPIQCIIDDLTNTGKLEECLLKVASNDEVVKLHLKIRGIRGLSKDLWIKAKRILAKYGIKHDPRSSICIFIESLDKTLYIGRGRCSLFSQ